jgi:hypothetical protein
MPRVKDDHIASPLDRLGLQQRVLALGLFRTRRWQYSREVVLEDLRNALTFVSRRIWGTAHHSLLVLLVPLAASARVSGT